MKLFISYAPEDEPYLSKLEKHLALLQKESLIETWHKRKIGAGADWRGAVDEQLEAAGLILLLVSADFIHSDYCFDVEVKRAMARHESGTATVLPILLRPCDWETAPFGKLEARPQGGQPVSKWQDSDDAFRSVAKAVRQIVGEGVLRSPPREDDTRSVQGDPMNSAVREPVVDARSASCEELVGILQDRAMAIVELLAEVGHGGEKDIARFTELHNKHIEYLRGAQFVRAHEVLRKIYSLSRELKKKYPHLYDRRSDGVYYLNGPRFTPGPVVCMYMSDYASEHDAADMFYQFGWTWGGERETDGLKFEPERVYQNILVHGRWFRGDRSNERAHQAQPRAGGEREAPPVLLVSGPTIIGDAIPHVEFLDKGSAPMATRLLEAGRGCLLQSAGRQQRQSPFGDDGRARPGNKVDRYAGDPCEDLVWAGRIELRHMGEDEET